MAVETVFANLPSPRASPAPKSRYRALMDDGEEGPLPPSAWRGGGILLYGWELDGTNRYPSNMTLFNVTLTAAPSVFAADGTLGAVQLFQETTANALPVLEDDYLASPWGPTQTTSVYAKPAPGAFRHLTIFLTAAADQKTYCAATFDVLNGRIVWSGVSSWNGLGTAPITVAACSIAQAGNGFWKCSLTAGGLATFTTDISLQTIVNPSYPAVLAYVGDGVSGVYLWRIKETVP